MGVTTLINAGASKLQANSSKKKNPNSNRPGPSSEKAIISIRNPAAIQSGGITIKATNNESATNEHILNVKSTSGKISIPTSFSGTTIRVAAGPATSTENKLQSELREINNNVASQ